MRVAGGTPAPTPAEQPTRVVPPVRGARSSRGSLPQEHVVVRLRQSGRRLVVPALLFIALCGAAGALGHPTTPAWIGSALLTAVAVLGLLLCALPALRWLNRVVLVTDRRVIVTRGFLVRRRQEFLLVPGTEAVLRRGPLQLLAGSGDVALRAGGAGSVTLRDVPSARLVHAAVVELVGRLR